MIFKINQLKLKNKNLECKAGHKRQIIRRKSYFKKTTKATANLKTKSNIKEMLLISSKAIKLQEISLIN